MEFRASRELPYHRRQLDRFRARPKDEQKFHPAPELTVSVSEAGHVDDDAAHQLFARNFAKPGMRHQHSDDVRAAKCLQGVAERHVRQRRQRLRQRTQIRLGDEDLLFSGACQLPDDFDRRALPQVVDSGL